MPGGLRKRDIRRCQRTRRKNVQEETQQGGEQSTAHGGEADEILMETEDGQQTDPWMWRICLPRKENWGTLGTRPADQTEKPAASTVQKPTGSTAQSPPSLASKPTAPENQKPVQKPAEESSKDVDLTAFYESLPGSVENWPSMMAMSQESVDAFTPAFPTFPLSSAAFTWP